MKPHLIVLFMNIPKFDSGNLMVMSPISFHPETSLPGVFPSAVLENAILQYLHFQWLIAIENAGTSCAGLVSAVYERKLPS